jgi:uncharacterized protein YukE
MAETLLLSTLDEYAKQMNTHLAALRERHQDLGRAWAQLREIYEGEGAQIFSEAFEAASAKLAEYGDQGAQIAHQLKSKIEDLRAFELPDSEL